MANYQVQISSYSGIDSEK